MSTTCETERHKMGSVDLGLPITSPTKTKMGLIRSSKELPWRATHKSTQQAEKNAFKEGGRKLSDLY